jgi:hypothetical protein
LPPTNHFSLGRWHWPVVLLAIVWLVAEIGVLTLPDEFHPSAQIAGIVLAVGVALYLLTGRVHRKTA